MTKPRNEERAKRNLESGGFQVFAPKLKRRRLRDNRLFYVVEEMFPGYIFVRFHPRRDFRIVKYTRGVKDVVRFGERIVPIGDDVIEYLRVRSEESNIGNREVIPPGSRVLILEGPFKGLEAIFEKELKPKERVSLLLEGLRYNARIVVDRDMILPFSD